MLIVMKMIHLNIVKMHRLISIDYFNIKNCFFKLVFFLLNKAVLKPLIQLALELSKLKEFTGRTEPTVVT